MMKKISGIRKLFGEPSINSFWIAFKNQSLHRGIARIKSGFKIALLYDGDDRIDIENRHCEQSEAIQLIITKKTD